jgi:hypothetical protein
MTRAGETVHRHDFLGIGVGLRLVKIDLRIMGLLAEPGISAFLEKRVACWTGK